MTPIPTKKPKHRHDNAITGSPPSSPEVLIPSLPNDVALNILARVPRRYHPIVSAVSKSIRTAISSAEFFSLRSLLKCTEPLLYIRLRSPSKRPADWFVAHGRTPSRNPSNNQSNLILAPVPPIPSRRLNFSSCAVVGTRIYVLGGSADRHAHSTRVWVLDCRFHTWERGPRMRSPRAYSRSVVLDGKIYVIGGHGSKEDHYAEVLDPAVGRWEAVPSPPRTYFWMYIRDCFAVGGVIHLLLGSWEELSFDPRTQTWEVISSPVSVCYRQRCVVDGELYQYNWTSGTLACFDDRLKKWKKLEVATKGLPKRATGIRMSNVGGRLVMIFSKMSKGKDWTEHPEHILEMWFGEIKGKKNGEYREDVCWEKVLSRSRSDYNVSEEVYSYHFPIFFHDCDCVSVSL